MKWLNWMAADFNDQEIALVANLSTAKLPWWPIFEHMRSVSTHSPWRKSKSRKNTHNFWHYFLGLFTKGNINWGVPEMWDGSFLHNCKKVWWNLKKMPKKGKIGFKFFSHHNICQHLGPFLTLKIFSVWYFCNPPFLALLRKLALKTGS